MNKKYKQKVVVMEFDSIDRFYNDLEDKISRLGNDGYRVVGMEKGIMDKKEHVVIVMEKEVIEG